MPVALAVVAAVEVATTVASTVEQKRATDAAARTATQTAQYNANLDNEEAKQIDLDSTANIQAMRKDAAVYMSRQTAAYAGSGVLANTGSPLAVRVATAGKLALREQQAYADAQSKEQLLASKAQAGIAEGAAQADQYHMEGIADVMGGAGKVAGIIGSAVAGMGSGPDDPDKPTLGGVDATDPNQGFGMAPGMSVSDYAPIPTG